MPPKRGGPGRPPDDDDEAVRWVQRHLREHPRTGYRQAARKYFEKHPEKRKTKANGKGKVKLESEARRVGDKAGEQHRGIPTRSEWNALLGLQRHLIFGLHLVNDLLGRWKKRPKNDDKRPGGGGDPER